MRFGSLLTTALLIACSAEHRSSFQDESPTDPWAGQAGNPGFGGEATAGIVLQPKNKTIIIDTGEKPITPGEVKYKVLAHGKDVTSASTFELQIPDIGTFDGSTFKTTTQPLPDGRLGISTMVKARSAEGVGIAQLTIVRLRQSGPERDFFFIVPYKGKPSPTRETLEFSTKIKQVDVAFAMDTTSSMGSPINNLKSALTGTLLSSLQAAIPNVGLAIADYRDYPGTSHGDPGDWPVQIHQKVTTNLVAAQDAVDLYQAGGGHDLPEAQIPAMQHILTGEALIWPAGEIPAVTPSPGHFGAVDFRPGSVPVVVNITDINWHDDYEFPAPTLATLKDAFKNANAFFVDVSSGNQAQAKELSDATNSNVPPSAFGGSCGGDCCTGANGAGQTPDGPGGNCRLVFKHSNGNGVSTGIVAAIEAISAGASYDIKAVPSNDPTNANNVDATKFIQTLRAMDEGDEDAGCPAVSAKDTDGDGINDTFISVTVGTKVCFEVIPAPNGDVPPKDTAQFYNAFVDVIGVPGNIQLDRRAVLFLVPPKDPDVK